MPDTLTKAQRSYCMSRVKGQNTGLEKIVFRELKKKKLKFKRHDKTLPGKPDIVFPSKKLAVFVDGDFWHGFRFPLWKHKVPVFWQEKISKTRARDQRNFRKLRRMGWTVIRIWQHEIKKNLPSCINKIKQSLAQ